jgi:hypothetical protein
MRLRRQSHDTAHVRKRVLVIRTVVMMSRLVLLGGGSFSYACVEDSCRAVAGSRRMASRGHRLGICVPRATQRAPSTHGALRGFIF